MKALSIRQPWAELIASGRKTVETRRWYTQYRGPLLIVAGKEFFVKGCFDHLDRDPRPEELGHAVAIANLVGISAMSEEHEKAAFVKASPGLWAWRLIDIQRIRPFAVKGRLGLFEVPDGQIVTLQEIADQKFESQVRE